MPEFEIKPIGNITYDEVYAIVRNHGPIDIHGIVNQFHKAEIKRLKKLTGMTLAEMEKHQDIAPATKLPAQTQAKVAGCLFNLAKTRRIHAVTDTKPRIWKAAITLPEVVAFLKKNGYKYHIEKVTIHTNGKERKLLRTNMRKG